MTTLPLQPLDKPKLHRLPKELVGNTLFLLKRLGDAVKEQVSAEFTVAECKAYHHAVLAVLAEGATETQAAIADALGFDRSQLVGILDELEEQGLVERRRDLHDRRRHLVRLTADGKRALARQRAVIKRVEKEFLAPLDPTTRERLHDILLELARHHDSRYAANGQTD